MTQFCQCTEIFSILLQKEPTDGLHGVMGREQWIARDQVCCLFSSSLIVYVFIRLLNGEFNKLTVLSWEIFISWNWKKAITTIQKDSS